MVCDTIIMTKKFSKSYNPVQAHTHEKHSHTRNHNPVALSERECAWPIWCGLDHQMTHHRYWCENWMVFWLCHFPWYRKQLPAALIIEKAHNSSLSLPHWPSLPPSHQFKYHLTFCFNYPGHFLQWHWAQKWCCGHCAALELNLD